MILLKLEMEDCSTFLRYPIVRELSQIINALQTIPRKFDILSHTLV